MNVGQQSGSPRVHVRRLVRSLAMVGAVGASVGALVTPAYADGAAPAKGASRSCASSDEDSALDRSPTKQAERGVVVLQRRGQPLGLGTVLAGDGRILSALSPLGEGKDLEAKFADGSVQKVRVGHQDSTWDLALLVPQNTHWKDGLLASSVDPIRDEADLRAFSNVKGKPVAAPIDIRSHKGLVGMDRKSLRGALDLGSRTAPKDVGAPLVDESGRVVGVLGRACAPGAAKLCAPVVFGIPVPAIKSFLRTVPDDAVPPTPWLGIRGAPESTPVARGLRVSSVAKGSPASVAKLKGGADGSGDLLVAVAGKPVETPEDVANVVRERGVGETIPITLVRDGLYRTVDVTLGPTPESLVAGTNDASPAPPPKVKPRKAGRAHARESEEPEPDDFAQPL